MTSVHLNHSPHLFVTLTVVCWCHKTLLNSVETKIKNSLHLIWVFGILWHGRYIVWKGIIKKSISKVWGAEFSIQQARWWRWMFGFPSFLLFYWLLQAVEASPLFRPGAVCQSKPSAKTAERQKHLTERMKQGCQWKSWNIHKLLPAHLYAVGFKHHFNVLWKI